MTVAAFDENHRDVVSLDGPWYFSLGSASSDPRVVETPLKDVDGRVVDVPASFDDAVPEEPLYEGPGWFRRRVDVPKAWADRRVVLRFEAVNDAAAVWVNGALAGRFELAYLPVELDVSHLVKPGEENEVVVLADSTRRDDRLPNGVWTAEKAAEGGGATGLAWHPAGGIIREVSLYTTGQTYLDGLRVSGVPDGGAFALSVVAHRNEPRDGEGELSAIVTDGNGKEVLRLGQRIALKGNGATTVRLQGEAPGVKPWSPDAPVLYTCRVQLSVGGAEADGLTARFGFRRIETRDGKLMLNGAPVFLTGFNRHDDTLARGACPDLAVARADLEAIKAMGANYVRLCHYPNHPGVLDLCDALGLLVMEEIPLFWWRGKSDGKENYAAQIDAAKRHLSALITRDYNHPSVVFWSVGNEWQTHRPGVREGTEALIAHVKAEDDTRLVMHVSDHWRREFGCKDYFDADDVIAITGYPEPPTGAWWVEGIERLRDQYPGRPVLLTELGHLIEELQIASFEAAAEATSQAETCGFAVWAWADYRGSREMGNVAPNFGVYTRDRQPKKAVKAALQAAFDQARENGKHFGY